MYVSVPGLIMFQLKSPGVDVFPIFLLMKKKAKSAETFFDKNDSKLPTP